MSGHGVSAKLLHLAGGDEPEWGEGGGGEDGYAYGDEEEEEEEARGAMSLLCNHPSRVGRSGAGSKFFARNRMQNRAAAEKRPHLR